MWDSWVVVFVFMWYIAIMSIHVVEHPIGVTCTYMYMYIVFLHTGGVGSIGKVVSIKDWKSETVVSMYNHVFCAYHYCDY